MQKYVHLVDLVTRSPTNMYLQNLASIQKRTSPIKFPHLAEKSGKGSISSLSTKVMNAVSERDADGNPVTQQEMFDTKWVALCLVIMLAALAKSAGAF